MTTGKRHILRARKRGPHPVETPARPKLTVVPVAREVAPRRITFKRFAAVNLDAYRRHGLSTRHELYMRVYFLALADANRLQHAEYATGALREALSSVNERTGEVTHPTKAAVSKAIAKAIETDLLDPLSSARCLVLPARSVSGGTGSNSCKFHGINQKNSTPRP
jgi:hypothetical protein